MSTQLHSDQLSDPRRLLPRLRRVSAPPAAPVRIVHLGLGNFHRAHQAWYTAHAADAGEWGIAAFTGRRADTADALAPQDGLYTLITRTADGDAFDVIVQRLGGPRGRRSRRVAEPVGGPGAGRGDAHGHRGRLRARS